MVKTRDKNNWPGSFSMRGSLSSRSSEGRELMQWPFGSGMVLGWRTEYLWGYKIYWGNKKKSEKKLESIAGVQRVDVKNTSQK